MTSVLFVCTGNICRSPTAEGVLRTLAAARGMADSVTVDSCGLIGYHVGEAPDHRSRRVAAGHGIHLDGMKARKFRPADFQQFDLIIAMDQGHEEQLRDLADGHQHDQIRLLSSFAPDRLERDVPDPYYGTMADFHHTYAVIVAGCEALLDHLAAGS